MAKFRELPVNSGKPESSGEKRKGDASAGGARQESDHDLQGQTEGRAEGEGKNKREEDPEEERVCRRAPDLG